MAGKKKLRVQKPVSARKKWKESSGYLKDSRVAPEESAGSGYRAKLKARQHGNPDGSVKEGFEFKENLGSSFTAARENVSKPKQFQHSEYVLDTQNPPATLITESFRGPAARETVLMANHYRRFIIPPVTNDNLNFKPCFLVAERLPSDAEESSWYPASEWRISHYTGISDPDGNFHGEIKEIGVLRSDVTGLACNLVEWCRQFSYAEKTNHPNHMFPKAPLIKGTTDPYRVRLGKSAVGSRIWDW